MELIEGKAVSEQIKQEIAAEVAQIVAQGGKRPHLAAILVGHDGGSETYVAAKVKACEVCGFQSSLIRYESDVTAGPVALDEVRDALYAETLTALQEANVTDTIDAWVAERNVSVDTEAFESAYIGE